MAAGAPKPVSIIVPTYKEAENIPGLVEAIELVANRHALQVELLLMDDNSRDGTDGVVSGLAKPWVKLVTRTTNRGLSPAVLEGLNLASYEYLVVMDADLSHPPSAIPNMLKALDNRHDFAVGSRYVPGASTDENWGVFRWLNSKVATLLAYPLTSIKDPMSGFFALKRDTFKEAAALNPIGYKVGLELLVKCACRNPAEIPIHFADRKYGESKLTLKQQLLYIQHLRRLFLYKYAESSHIAQFLFVGCIGVIINLVTVTVSLWAGTSPHVAIALGILVSMMTNFVLNRRFTFSYARQKSFWKQLVGFMSSCTIGAVVNYITAIKLIGHFAVFAQIPQLAALVGIIAGTGFNYLISRYVVFKKAS